MKVKSTLYYGEMVIADCEWVLDDRARTTQQALAALSIEDHLKAGLKCEHKIITEGEEPKKNDTNESVNTNEEREAKNHDDVEDKSDAEAGRSCDQPVQDNEDREFNRVDDWTKTD